MDKKKIGFHWNPLMGTIEKQANEQGYTLGGDAEEINGYQDSLFGMHFDGIITNKMYEQILPRLQKYVISCLHPLEKDNHTPKESI